MCNHNIKTYIYIQQLLFNEKGVRKTLADRITKTLGSLGTRFQNDWCGTYDLLP